MPDFSDHTFVKEVHLQNFRCFDDFVLDLHPRLTVLGGTNGRGKTTLLDSIAYCLSTWVRQLSREPKYLVTPSDVRTVQTSSTPVVMEPQFPSRITTSFQMFGKPLESVRGMAHKSSGGQSSKQLVLLGQETLLKVQNGSVEPLPLLSYYGTGRLWKQRADSGIKRNSDLDKSRLSGYEGCLNSASSFESFKEWFAYATFADLQARQAGTDGSAQADTPYSLLLREVSRAVDICVQQQTGWGQIRYDVALEAVVLTHSQFGVLSLSQLSDGIRGLVSLVADIAYRCVRLNGIRQTNVLMETPGIVLIDEIDLHLHPGWQQAILPSLLDAFPQVQFIVTTHSPQVLTAVDHECIRLLRSQDGRVEAITPEFSLGATSAHILEELMGVPS